MTPELWATLITAIAGLLTALASHYRINKK